MALTISDLPDETFLHLRGSDIAGFLQGQLTCDLRRLMPERSVAGAMCSVKGRVLSDLWVIPVAPEHCVLRLRRSVATPFADNLRRYAQFSRISVTEEESDTAVRGLVGTRGDLDRLLGEAPGATRMAHDRLWFRSGPCTAQILDVGESEASAATDEDLFPDTELQRGTPGAWSATELQSGHYAIEADDWDRFTPQALNYDRSDRVAFDKGCYTGQEVVARLHYKGQAKKRLSLYSASDGDPVPRGAAVLDGSGTRLGEVLRCEPAPSGGAIVAVLLKADREGEALVLEGGTSLVPIGAAA